jgi:uncharacterized hydrophobic protein (TIGR00271 family)
MNATTNAQTRGSMVNAATARGGAAVFVGLLVLLLPGFSLTLVEAAVGLGLLASGLYDLWYALTGRSRGHRRASRILALVRGSASLLFAGLVALAPREALDLLVELVGLYLLLRGLLAIGAAVFSRGVGNQDPHAEEPVNLVYSHVLSRRVANRWSQVGTGLAAICGGALAILAPDAATTGLIVGGAILSVLVGAIVLTYGIRGADDGEGLEGADAPVAEILWDWVRQIDMGPERREGLADNLYFENPGKSGKLVAWWVMLLLSVTIATYAVLLDSTSVVIGAMLIAPLMVPILGLAGALVNGWGSRAASSLRLLGAGVASAVLLSYTLSNWAPVLVAFDTNSQITSRINPSLLDMLIAVAAGAAGAFATVNVRVASSIAGVAIAVALVPPLSVVGICLGADLYGDAGGAMLLFLTNFVAIVLSASVVFAMGGFARPDLLRSRSRDIAVTMGPFLALAAVILIPLVFTSRGLLASATEQRQAQDIVEEWLGEDSPLGIQAVAIASDAVEVDLIGPVAAPALEPLQQSLIEELRRPVAVTVLVTPVTAVDLPVPLREPDPVASESAPSGSQD